MSIASTGHASGVTINRAVYAVRFKRMGTLLANEFGLSGEGEFEFELDELIIRANQRKGLTRTPVEMRVPRDSIEDATQRGRRVWFQIVDPSGVRRRMVAHARSTREAEGLFAALPVRTSLARARAQVEAQDFADKVLAITPRIWVTPTLIGINVIVFAVMVFAGAGLINPEPGTYLRFGSNYGPLTAEGQWWRLATSTFLHFGILHVVLNMWALRDGGSLAERLLGSWTMLFIYLISGIFGSAASLAWNPAVHSVGASGAIFGVYGAVLSYVLDRRNGVPVTVMKEIRFSLLLFIGYAVVIGLAASMIDNAAHFGGLAAGTVSAFLLARPLDAAARAARPRWPTPVLALVLAAATGWAAHYALDIAHRANESHRLTAMLPPFLANQQRLNAMHRLGVAGATKRPAAEVVDFFNEQADRWERIRADFTALDLADGTDDHLLRDRVVRLAETRGRVARLIAAGLVANDQKKVAEAGELLQSVQPLDAEITRSLTERGTRKKP